MIGRRIAVALVAAAIAMPIGGLVASASTDGLAPAATRSSGADATPPPAATPAASPAATPLDCTPPPSVAASSMPASVAPATTAAASIAAAGHADPALEALLPTSLGGVALTVESQRGTDLTVQSAALDAFLADLGRGLGDFSRASATSRGGELHAHVGAWRVSGAVTECLTPAFVRAVRASSTIPLTVTQPLVGGRPVTQVGAVGELTQGPLYAFVRGDTILFVQTPEPTLADEAIAKMTAAG
jgi:hypothetical protein